MSASVEEIVDCDAIRKGEAVCGPNGGWPRVGLEYIIDEKLTSEEDYSYCLSEGCQPCEPKGYVKEECGPRPFKVDGCYDGAAKAAGLKKPFTLSSWNRIDTNEDTIKE